MSFTVFNPPVAPDQPLTLDEKPRVITNTFGDGYSEDIGDGIHTTLKRHTLKWSNLRLDTELTPILDVFRNAQGYKRLQYTVPGEATPSLYKVVSWRRVIHNDVYGDLTAVFQEVPA